MNVFADYAAYYDLLYPEEKFEEEAAFVDSLLRKHGGKPRSILDLGCGTGRHAFRLSRLGYAVTGVDRSAEMLRQARKRNAGQPDVEFVQSDIAELELPGTFDAVVSLFHVMSYMTEPQALERALAAARRRLEPGGRLLFDYWHAPCLEIEGVQTRVRRLTVDGRGILRIVEPRTLPDNRVDVDITMLVIDKGASRLVHEIQETHAMRAWNISEIDAALARTGFVPILHGGWLTFEAPTAKTWGAFVLARSLETRDAGQKEQK